MNSIMDIYIYITINYQLFFYLWAPVEGPVWTAGHWTGPGPAKWKKASGGLNVAFRPNQKAQAQARTGSEETSRTLHNQKKRKRNERCVECVKANRKCKDGRAPKTKWRCKIHPEAFLCPSTKGQCFSNHCLAYGSV